MLLRAHCKLSIPSGTSRRGRCRCRRPGRWGRNRTRTTRPCPARPKNRRASSLYLNCHTRRRSACSPCDSSARPPSRDRTAGICTRISASSASSSQNSLRCIVSTVSSRNTHCPRQKFASLPNRPRERKAPRRYERQSDGRSRSSGAAPERGTSDAAKRTHRDRCRSGSRSCPGPSR